jgi:hypothetical protein
MPLEFRVQIGMAFWERTVEFSHDNNALIGDTAAGSAQGKISTKWRLHIVRSILGDHNFLTTQAETHGNRGLETPHIPPEVRWQWMRLADAREENPENHSPHKGLLKLDASWAVDRRRISSSSYVFAGLFARCSLTENWRFAGYLEPDSVTLLEMVGQRVVQLQQKENLHQKLHDSINWEAMDEGRKLRGLDAFPRPFRRQPRQNEIPQPVSDNGLSVDDRGRAYRPPVSGYQPSRDYQDSSRDNRATSSAKSYQKDQPQPSGSSGMKNAQGQPAKVDEAGQNDDSDTAQAVAPRTGYSTRGFQSWSGGVHDSRVGVMVIGPNHRGEQQGRSNEPEHDDEVRSQSSGRRSP